MKDSTVCDSFVCEDLVLIYLVCLLGWLSTSDLCGNSAVTEFEDSEKKKSHKYVKDVV